MVFGGVRAPSQRVRERVVRLRAGGEGWYQLSRPDYADIACFRWRRTGPGRIELTWHSAREIFGGVVTEQKPDHHPAMLGYRIGVEDTPLAGRVRMPRMEPPVGFAREFGLVSTQPAATAEAGKR
ncbi:MAG: hypothetical protein GEV28_35885 [Actinophytocola sp.]|uniref:hypothetical protein n=1 Tax=Actinophytocola sp. TaxID=1872138 RepID=UPI001326CB81|nr:hypothetical protein [Actinophytocola sp.]MPZ85478.1 hypothetical protein [Actinophytocola sp.]